jgi:hypothetical protein
MLFAQKKFRRKQFFTSEDAANVRVTGKNSFDKIFFGEEEHNRLEIYWTQLLGSRSLLMHIVVQYYSVNFHFLNNDKSDSRHFFTVDTIGYGLPFDGIEGAFSLKFFDQHSIPFSESVSTYL